MVADPTEEIERLIVGEGVATAVAVDQAWPHSDGEITLVTERLDVGRDIAARNEAVGKYLRHQAQAEIGQTRGQLLPTCR